ncbi:uncharacterized protein LOC110376514 isoform X1 [Helicoverpa armigera]|uniref:uncharacterized protein LOC110376514 isoform X1 n=1 Tax=Helicoverpa armigera TaxID=29058 RepID=UPI003083752F
MRLFMTISLILLCLVDKSYGGFKDFLTNLPSEVAEAFKSTWSIIKSKVPATLSIDRPYKRAVLPYTQSSGASTYDQATERHGYIIEIPVIQEPRSRFQNRYRMIPSPIYNYIRGNRRIEEPYHSKLSVGSIPDNELAIEHPSKRNREFAEPYQSSDEEESLLESNFDIEKEHVGENSSKTLCMSFLGKSELLIIFHPLQKLSTVQARNEGINILIFI